MSRISDEERQRLAERLADALKASSDADQASGQAQAQAARQAAEIEGLLEGGERLALRGRDLRSSVQELRDTLERGRLSTLNAALEGARLGEVAGKALMAMTDEVRSALGRSADVLDDHATRVAELERERERMVLALGPLADAARAVASEITRSAERSRSQRDALAELSLELRQQFGVDPELGGLVARASREAADLLDTFAALEARGAHGEARELLARIAALAAPRPADGS
jgi:methyl-accepting chemotaxis protein